MRQRYEKKRCPGCHKIKVMQRCFETCNSCRADVDLKIDKTIQAFCLGRDLSGAV